MTTTSHKIKTAFGRELIRFRHLWPWPNHSWFRGQLYRMYKFPTTNSFTSASLLFRALRKHLLNSDQEHILNANPDNWHETPNILTGTNRLSPIQHHDIDIEYTINRDAIYNNVTKNAEELCSGILCVSIELLLNEYHEHPGGSMALTEIKSEQIYDCEHEDTLNVNYSSDWEELDETTYDWDSLDTSQNSRLLEQVDESILEFTRANPDHTLSQNPPTANTIVDYLRQHL